MFRHIFFVCLLISAPLAFAQEAPKPQAGAAAISAAKAAADGPITLTEQQTDKAEIAALRAENAAKDVQTLALQIQQMQARLRSLQDAARAANEAADALVAEFAKIPVAELSSYDATREAGKLILRKKPAPAPAARGQQ